MPIGRKAKGSGARLGKATIKALKAMTLGGAVGRAVKGRRRRIPRVGKKPVQKRPAGPRMK